MGDNGAGAFGHFEQRRDTPSGESHSTRSHFTTAIAGSQQALRWRIRSVNSLRMRLIQDLRVLIA